MADLLESPPEFNPWLPGDNLTRVYDWVEVFGNSHPLEIELGAGDGGFIVEWAKRHPDTNFVALERLLGRVKKIAKRSVRENLPHVRALRLESGYFLKYLCPAESVSVLHFMFPDPWPKRKHHKFRLVQPEFIESCRKVLKPGGVFRFTTDHQDYFLWTTRLWGEAEGWENLGPWDASGDPQSDFELEFEKEGRAVHRMRWRKK